MTKHYPINVVELDALADRFLELDVEGVPGAYTEFDLQNALLVLSRVAGSIAFSRYLMHEIDFDKAEQSSVHFGQELRKIIIAHTGLDPHQIAVNMGKFKLDTQPSPDASADVNLVKSWQNDKLDTSEVYEASQALKTEEPPTDERDSRSQVDD